MRLELIRDIFGDTFTLGKMYADGEFIGYTCEDKDRQLESGGNKVYAETAIPRGHYVVSITMSNRFKKLMPLIHDVPGFDGVRIHGGNTDKDTLGCPLLGGTRTSSGVANCAATNKRLMQLLEKSKGKEITLVVT